MYSCSEEDQLGDCGHGREWFGQRYSLFLTFLMLLQSNSTGLSLCSLSSPHHPTAGFSFYITLKVKHLTSPWRPFKAARSLQITYNSQKVSSLSPDRSLMPASFNLHMLAFQRSSFMSSLTLPPRSSLHTSVKLPHYPPPDTMESSVDRVLVTVSRQRGYWQAEPTLSCAAHPLPHHSHLLPVGCLFSCVVRLLSRWPCTELNKLRPLLMTPEHSCNNSL